MPGRRIGRAAMIVAGVVVVALVAGCVVWLLGRDDGSSRGSGTTPPPSGVVVQLTRVGIGNSDVPEGVAVELVVSAAAQQPLAAIELWDGGTLVQRRELADAPSATREAFTWQATAGDAVLTARAVDAAGHGALSNAVRIGAGGSPQLATVVSYTVREGDTPQSIAEAHGTSAQLIDLANPGALAADKLVPGAVLQIPVRAAFDPMGAKGGSDGPSRAIRGRATGTDAAGPGATPPAADVDVDGCTVTVPAPADTDGITGSAAYLLTPDAATFALAASAPATDALTFAIPAGTSMLVVGTYDDAVQQLGPPQPLNPSGPCADGWSGDVRLDGSVLVGNVDADVAYLYVSTGTTWERVPERGFVASSDGRFDFAGLLPDLSQGQVEIDAWGRRGGALVHLGSGSYRAPAPPPSGAAARTSLVWIKTAASGSQPEVTTTNGFVPNPGVLSFRWKAASPLVTKAAWQVTSYLVPAAAGVDVPGVIAQGFVGADETVFPIDFSTFAGTKTVSTASASAALAGLATIGGNVVVPPGAASAGTTSTPAVAIAASGPVVGGSPVLDPALPTASMPAPSTFYVRLVPFVGEQFTGTASNSVTLHTKFDPALLDDLVPEAPGANVYELDLQVTAPIPPIPWFAKCWTITEIDPLQFDPQHSLWNAAWLDYVKVFGNTVCPICYVKKIGSTTYHYDFTSIFAQDGWHCKDGDEGFDLSDPSTWDEFPILGPLVSGLLEGVITGWDFAVGIAMYLKAKVVELVAEVGCSTFVKAGAKELGTSPPQETDAWCKQLAETAIDVALVSFGIPPTLPTFEQAMQAAKGDLADAVVELAGDLGIPCDEADTAAELAGEDALTCKALAEALIDELVQAAKAAVSASAAASSGIFFPPGVYAVPHGAGQVTPGAVAITVTPTPQAPSSGLTCPATVTMWAAYDAPNTAFGQSKFPELNIGYSSSYGVTNGLWVPAGTYGGPVIHTTNVPLPTLPTASGAPQAATKNITLSKLYAHDEVQGKSYGGAGGGPSWVTLSPLVPYEALQLHPGAELVTTVHADCAQDTLVSAIIVGGGKIQVTKVVG